jgi:hypothetical protein
MACLLDNYPADVQDRYLATYASYGYTHLQRSLGHAIWYGHTLEQYIALSQRARARAGSAITGSSAAAKATAPATRSKRAIAMRRTGARSCNRISTRCSPPASLISRASGGSWISSMPRVTR